MGELPPCPASLKQIQHYLKAAQEHDNRDVIVSYWSRLYGLQLGLKLSTHQPEETKLLMAIMDWLEKAKTEHADNESITNEVAAQAYLENYALKLFLYADKQDREGNFGKNVVKAFYTSGLIYDILQTFGELTDEATQNRKYAKWKAAYIHNCLKSGITPTPGPMANEDEDENENEGAVGGEQFGGSGQNQAQFPTLPSEGSPSEPMNQQPPRLDAEEVLRNPEKLPSPPVDEEKPGGFIAYIPPRAGEQPNPYTNTPPKVDFVEPDVSTKAQKYCKLAGSAINFDDIPAAIDYLQKALRLITTGQE